MFKDFFTEKIIKNATMKDLEKILQNKKEVTVMANDGDHVIATKKGSKIVTNNVWGDHYELPSTFMIVEKVSGDCSTGSGVVPGGPWNGYKIIRTSHLDEPRNPPSPIQRDQGVTCNYFDEIAKALFRKRPLGMKTGDYAIFWKNAKGVQNAMVRIDAEKKTITFVTMIQQSKPMNKYRVKQGTVKLDLGIVKEPK